MVNLHEAADWKEKSLCGFIGTYVNRHHFEQLETTCEDEESSQVSMKILKVLDTVLLEGSVREILYYFFCRYVG